MKPLETLQALQKVTYNRPEKIKFLLHTWMGAKKPFHYLNIVVYIKNSDAEAKRQFVWTMGSTWQDIAKLEDENELYELVYETLRSHELHELDEFLRIDGKPFRDPHSQDDLSNSPNVLEQYFKDCSKVLYLTPQGTIGWQWYKTYVDRLYRESE